MSSGQYKNILMMFNMDARIRIRKYKEADAKFLSQIFYNTIHTINTRDYSSEQVNAWAPKSTLDPEGWMQRWAKLPPLVAELVDTVVGFAEFESNGHIDCFYVHHEFQGCGVGSALMKEIEKRANKKDIPRIFAEVSITARPFFEAKGFSVVKQQTVKRHDVELVNFIMEKNLHSDQLIKEPDSMTEWAEVKRLRQQNFFDKAGIKDPYQWTFNHSEHRHWILYQSNEIIGYAHVQLWPNLCAAMRIIVIEEGYRKKGYGGLLLKFTERYLEDEGYKSLHVESTKNALSFYRDHNYIEGKFPDPEEHETHPEDVALVKSLNT